jgi:hypothetical protein
MKRRAFFIVRGALISLGLDGEHSMKKVRAAVRSASMDLLSAPLEVNGDFGESARAQAAVVISHMREACLSGGYGCFPTISGSAARRRSDRRTSGYTENPKAAKVAPTWDAGAVFRRRR